jgi:hypothetical protein
MMLRSTPALAGPLILAALSACSSGPPSAGKGGASGAIGDAKDGGSGGMCALDPVGSYVFHVHNGAAVPRYWFTYCGKALPLILDTPAGALPAGPGTIGSCGFTCDKLYADPTYPPYGCTDCGGGTWIRVQPGETVDIAWDRRVYSAHTLEAPCSPWSGQTCAMGKTVARSTAQTGTIHVCDSYVIVSCNGPHDVPFTVDTTKNEGTIELGP